MYVYKSLTKNENLCRLKISTMSCKKGVHVDGTPLTNTTTYGKFVGKKSPNSPLSTHPAEYL